MIKLLTFNRILFLVLLSIIAVGCQDDLYEEAVRKPPKIKIERFSMKNANHVRHAALIKSTSQIAEALIVPLKHDKFSARTIYDSILGIEYDDEKGVYIQNGEYESYTFPIYNITDEYMKSLVFSKNDNDTFDIFIAKYTVDELSYKTMSETEKSSIKPAFHLFNQTSKEFFDFSINIICDVTTTSMSVPINSGDLTGQFGYETIYITTTSNCSISFSNYSGGGGSSGGNGGGDGGGGGGTNGTGPPPSGYNGQDPAIHGNQGPIITAPVFEEEPPNPCQLISVLKSDDVFKQKMVALKNAAQQWSRELLFTVYDDPNPNSQVSQTDNYNYFEFMGTVNNPSASWTGNQTMKGMIHSHYNGLLSVFSPQDLKQLY